MLDLVFAIAKKRHPPRLAAAPSIALPDATMQRGFLALQDMLRFNLMAPVGRIDAPWVRPAPKFPAAYLWDSAFISQAWKWWDPAIAVDILRPFVVFQDPESGRMPHLVLLGRFTSKLSNPPFLAWAVNGIRELWNEAPVDGFLDPIVAFTAFRKQYRYHEDHGLYFWSDSYESGIDNSPRFRSVDEKEDYGVNSLGAIDLNAEIVLQHQAIVSLARAAGRDHDPAIAGIRAERDRLAAAIEATLWDPGERLFGDLDVRTGKLVTIDTIASYFPLAIDGLDPAKTRAMVDRLADPAKYNTLVPLPSVAKDSPHFTKDMWRGPVWLNTAYLVVKGLERQGHGALAGDLAFRLARGVYETWKNEGNFYEFYDPDRHDLVELDRKKGNLYKKITLGSKPVKDFAGWTALANSLVIEHVFGLQRRDGYWSIAPHLPESWMVQGKTATLALPALGVEASLVAGGDGETIHVTARAGGREHAVDVPNHGRAALD